MDLPRPNAAVEVEAFRRRLLLGEAEERQQAAAIPWPIVDQPMMQDLQLLDRELLHWIGLDLA